MTLTLHYLPGSPYAWRVHLALEHKAIAHEIKNVDLGGGELRSEAYMAMNPRSKVPVLRDGDFTLYESAAMLEYLEDKYPDTTKLYPTEIEARARVRRLICEIDNYWFPATMMLVQNLYFKSNEADWDESEIKQGRDGLLTELKFFEREVHGDSLTRGAGGELCAADLALYPMLAHLARYEKRRANLGLTDALGPNLRRLMARVQSQPYFDKTFPKHWK